MIMVMATDPRHSQHPKRSIHPIMATFVTFRMCCELSPSFLSSNPRRHHHVHHHQIPITWSKNPNLLRPLLFSPLLSPQTLAQKKKHKFQDHRGKKIRSWMMDYHANHGMFVRRSFVRERNPAARWVRVWVPQEVTATGKRIYLLKWAREDMLKVLKEKFKEPESEEPKPEPTTEILFLCNYEGCYKASPNEGQHRKHAHIHGERQFVCSFPGCGKAFNLDFNLRAHMKIHSQEHYHICPYPDCSKIYTQECKLKSHIKAHHEKG